MTFVVDRAGHDVDLTATPKITVVDQGAFGKRRIGHLGLASSAIRRTPRSSVAAFRLARPGARRGMVHRQGDRRPIWSAVRGPRIGRPNVGTIGAAQIAGEMAKISLWELFSLAAWFSVSVGLMNLLPIPLLDGGHLAFYAFEALRGRPLSERAQEIGLRIGIALVAMLGGFHHLARHLAAGRERQLTIGRP